MKKWSSVVARLDRRRAVAHLSSLARMRFLRLPPVMFMMLFAAASVAQRYVAAPTPLPRPAQILAAATILVLASLLATSALYEMWSRRTPVEPGHVPRVLVTTGSFRISRNPLYLTLVLIQLAGGLFSLWFLPSAVLLAILLDRLVIRREESVLDEAFAEAFANYRKRVRRWI